jgi:hypothetical protein
VVNPGLPNPPEFHEYFNEVRRNANLYYPLITTILSDHFALGDMEVKYLRSHYLRVHREASNATIIFGLLTIINTTTTNTYDESSMLSRCYQYHVDT